MGAAGVRAQTLPPALEAQHQGPVHVSGDQFLYDYKTDKFVIEGHAILTQASTVLTADRIDLMKTKERGSAEGQVHLIDPEAEMFATKARVNLADETFELTDGKIFARNGTYHLEGERIEKFLGQSYSVRNGFFTTCGCNDGRPDWSITAERIDVRMGDQGEARNAEFRVAGYPLIPLPYAVFPADTDRHSGLLSPRLGESGLRGFQYLQSYFLDINKSSDATVALDVETSQRVGLLGEYRIVNGDDDFFQVTGGFFDEHIRTNLNRQSDIIDNQIANPFIPTDRWDVIGTLREHLTPDLVVYGNGVSAGDSLLMRELDVWTLSRGYGEALNVLRWGVNDFGLWQSFDNSYVKLGGTYNEDWIQPQQLALQTLPALEWSGRRELLGGLAYADWDSQAIDYYRPEGSNGLRGMFNPQITIPWRLGDYLSTYAQAGFYSRVYDVGGDNIGIIPINTPYTILPDGRVAITPTGKNIFKWNNGLFLSGPGPEGVLGNFVPYFHTGASTVLERVYDVNSSFIEKIKNTITPFVDYAYVPPIHQSSLPLFDQFDRIEARSLLTYGFTTSLYAKLPPDSFLARSNRFQGPEEPEPQADSSALVPTVGEAPSVGTTTEELLRLTVEQAYDTHYPVSLSGTSGLSDLQAATTLFPNRLAQLGGYMGFDPRAQKISYSTAFFSFQPPWTVNTSPVYMGKALVGSFFELNYVYLNPEETLLHTAANNATEFVTFRTYYELLDRLGLFFSPAYDVATQRLLSTEYGARIKSKCNCWAFDFGVTNSVNPSELQFQFQLTLGGLGSLGHSPFGSNPFHTSTSVLPGNF